MQTKFAVFWIGSLQICFCLKRHGIVKYRCASNWQSVMASVERGVLWING